MCHFHSVIVTGDGRILHLPNNSHSSIAEHHNLESGLDAKWWECEWDGKGEMPMFLIQTRGKTAVPTSLAERAAENHYRKLVQVLAGADPMEIAPFNLPEYSDVREVYEAAIAERQTMELLAPLVEKLVDLDGAAANELIRRLVDELSLDMSEIAADEIEEAIENDESRYEAGYEAGICAAAEEMYSYEDMQERIDEAVEEAKAEWEDTAHDEAYEEGYMDAKRCKAPAVDFIGGMPSFLI